MTQLKGIDVSHWQGAIDWGKVKGDGVEFAFIKATQGTNYDEVSYFKENVPKALAAGIHVGAYHYGTFGTAAEAKAEAAYFLSVIKGFTLEYPLVLDLEENKKGMSNTQLTDAAIAFLKALENAGYFAMLYTGKTFLETQLDESRLTSYSKWIARYNNELGRSADMWQFTSSGKVNGISGNVDLNWAYRDFTAVIRGMNKTTASQPAAAQQPKKEYAYFPPNAGTWRVYPLNKAPTAGNEVGAINPTKFGGLEYEILARPYPNVATIQTSDFGKVNIYIGADSKAQVRVR
ncbi:glycoside hydrolase family 25 protein [Neobacillus ginsengisoli]|uniref:Lysozyme n=1 Tax=Neobacillus ginsengisoli TaxID=904295 RepID=A0ABT9XUS7_9BACI|nr:glycoside hydrolase family 25 protein [Neobacillus ginsengisoli]MDQ0199324.1 lysozyme [Neobacillus ginsengisoli]